MRDIHGTNAIGGLDVGKAAHLIDDSSLLESANGWTDRAGEWSVAPGNTRLYSGYTDMEDCCAGTIDGAEVVTYLDGTSFYADGVLIGTVPGTGDKQIVAVADGFLIVGGTKNYIYDVNGLREQGTWQADNVTYTDTTQYGVDVVQSSFAQERLIGMDTSSGVRLFKTDVGSGAYSEDDIVLFSDLRNGYENKDIDYALGYSTVTYIGSDYILTDGVVRAGYYGSSDGIGTLSLVTGGFVITGIAQEDNATVTTSGTLPDIGHSVFLSQITGMTELNDTTALVVSHVSATEFKINVDTTDYYAYVAGGIGIPDQCGYGGSYKYYMVPAIELSNGTILEGKPRGLNQVTDIGKHEENVTSDWEAESLYITNSDYVQVYMNLDWSSGSEDYFDISGTAGIDFFPILRLYRTKSNGADIYLEEEFRYTTNDEGRWLSYDSTEKSYYCGVVAGGYIYMSHKPDINLGAVYLYSNTAQENPLPAITAARLGSDVFFVPQDYPNQVHWTNPGAWEFSDPLNNVYMLDNITAVRMFRNEMIIFSERYIWAMQLIEGFPAIRQIETTVGSSCPKAMEEVPGALLFLREDGIWAFDGIKTFNTSHNTFYGTDTPVSIAASGDLVVAQWQSRGLVGKGTAMGTVWHDTDTTGAIVTDSGGSLYCADNDMIYSMFDGNKTCATLTSKAFDTKVQTQSGKLGEKRVYRVQLDVTGADIQECWINGTRQDDTLLHDARGNTDDRRLVTISIPRLSNPYITIRLQIGGNAVVHGYYFETEK